MTTLNFNSPVVFLRRTGNSSDPYISISQTMKIQNSQVLLQEIPDSFNKVTVTGTTNPVYEQNGGIPTPTSYVVDYTQGNVYFDSSLNGQTATFQYFGTGVAYVNIARIMTANNGTTVTQTLQDLTTSAQNATTYAQSAGDSLGYQGVYSAFTAYTRNNIVTYQGVTYICTSNTTAGTDPTNASNWSKITSWRWQGTYSSTATYNFGDYVVDSNNTNIYLCTQDGITNIPLSDTTKWVKILSVADAISAANTATSNANSATSSANSAASSANTSAQNAQNVANNTKHFGSWNSATTYQPNNVVSYSGSSYMCIVECTDVLPTDTSHWDLVASKGDQGIQGIQGIQGATGQGYNWRNAYDAATTYSPYDSVSYNGSSYVCTTTSTGNAPTDTTHWSLLAQKGADGAGTVQGISAANTDVQITGTAQNPIVGVVTSASGTASTIMKTDANGSATAKTFTSNATQGTAPLVVSSTTQVNNLNSQYLNGVTADQIFGQRENIASNASDQYQLVATLPPSGTLLDKLYIEIQGSAATSDSLTCDYYELSNRPSFNYVYYLSGVDPNNTRANYRVVAYQQADNSVQVYLKTLANQSVAAIVSAYSLNLNNNTTALVIGNPSTTVPSGSIVFDSGNSATYPPNAVIQAGSATFSNSISLNGGAILASGKTFTNNGTISGGTGNFTTLQVGGVNVLTSLPSDVAKTDVAQTWTQAQTWASSQTFPWSGLTGVPTDFAKTDVANTFTGNQTAPALIASGLTGATAPSRYVGATTSGAPTTGTFAVGDFAIDQTGVIWICTTAGAPGTWKKDGGGLSSIEIPYLLWVNSSTAVGTTGTAAGSGSSFLAKANNGYQTSTNSTSKLITLSSTWSSNTKFALEIFLYSGTSGTTVNAALWDFTANAIVSGTQISTSVQSTSAVPLRSTSVSLVNGRSYGVTVWSSSSSAYAYATDALLIAFPA